MNFKHTLNAVSIKNEFKVISFDDLTNNLIARVQGNNRKTIIKHELKIHKQELKDFLKSYYFDFFGKGLFNKLLTNSSLKSLVQSEDKYKSIHRLSLVWDRAKYILHLEKMSISVDTDNSVPTHKTINRKIPKTKQKKFLKLYVEELKKGIQKTDAIDYSYKKTGYKNSRQAWNIVRNVEEGVLIYKELTEILEK